MRQKYAEPFCLCTGTGVRDLASHGATVRGGADLHSGGFLVRNNIHPEQTQ